MASQYFPAIIEQWASGFGVTFPDFPGCTSYGETIQESALKAEEALAGHVVLMEKSKETIPQPTPLDQIPVDADMNEVARILVRVELARRVMRLNIIPIPAINCLNFVRKICITFKEMRAVNSGNYFS